MSHARRFDRMLMWCPILGLTLGDPLTRPAPAGENAGCGPPSPHRGEWKQNQHPPRLWGRGSGGNQNQHSPCSLRERERGKQNQHSPRPFGGEGRG